MAPSISRRPDRSTNWTPPSTANLPTGITSMRNEDALVCPVCGFDGLDEPAYDAHGCASFGICPCCGTEFGYNDATRTHVELRSKWIGNGMKWWSRTPNPPADWDPVRQLRVFEKH